jgi:SAM-dependent methyltransferase
MAPADHADHAGHIDDNRVNWDDRARVHAASTTYDLQRYVDDPSRLSTVVEFDRPHLGDVVGRSALHLQCHLGTDTITLARLGATPVVGLDQSGVSIEIARDLVARTDDEVEFVVADVHDAPTALQGRTFDLVYTGVGAINWLPDIDRWAGVVHDVLAPGGTFYIRECHPVLHSLNHDRDDEVLELELPYFETEAPVTWHEAATYTDVPDGLELAALPSHEWNHSLGEILTAVLDRGLVIEHFAEHTWTDWQPWGLFEPVAPGFWALPAHLRDRAPMMFSLRARRP